MACSLGRYLFWAGETSDSHLFVFLETLDAHFSVKKRGPRIRRRLMGKKRSSHEDGGGAWARPSGPTSASPRNSLGRPRPRRSEWRGRRWPPERAHPMAGGSPRLRHCSLSVRRGHLIAGPRISQTRSIINLCWAASVNANGGGRA